MRWLKRTRARAAFTLAEVALALAVVAFGLVAVLGVLPVGLNVQRDNREETLIKNDAEYWMNAIRGGRLALDSLNHVEWVEVETATGSLYRAEYAALQFDGAPTNASAGWPMFNGNQMPPITYRGSLKQSTWRGDVIGWLSVPNGMARKRAKVRPVGSTLLHRKFGEKTVGQDGKVMYRNAGGEQTFSYLLESSVQQVAPGFWEIKLTMQWPILEEGATADTVKIGPGLRTFVTYIHAPPEKALTRWGFAGDEAAVFDTLIPDTPLSVAQITQFLIGTKVQTQNFQQWTPAGVAAILNGLMQKQVALPASGGRWLPEALYDSYGVNSLRSPPGYTAMGDAAGNFVEFTAPTNGFFGEMYFFRPASD